VTLASLPTLNVYVAFNTTASSATLNTANQIPFSNTSYWTNVTAYVQDFNTNAGKQHFIDRVESATLQLTFNNRNGYFSGSPNTLNVRMPIGITATWNGTTYPIYWGFTESIRENAQDQLNSELTVSCSDANKMLALQYMASTNFWGQYANPSSNNTSGWYRATTAAGATITGATSVSAGGGSYNITYNAVNNFTVGQYVTISGLTAANGSTTGTFNYTNAVIQSRTPSEFVINVTFPVSTGNSSGTGTAYVSNIYNYLTNTSDGYYNGNVTFQNNGAMVYEANGCVDLGNGGTNFFTGASTTSGGEFYISTLPSGWSGVDFWILGNGISGQTIFTQDVAVSGTPSIYTLTAFVATTGEVSVLVKNGATPLGTAQVPNQYVNDGYWHHIGLVSLPNGYLELYVDGVFASGGAGLQSFGLFTFYTGSTNSFTIGHNNYTYTSNTFSSLIDEVILSTNANISTLSTEVQKRYKAGQILQQGQPITTYSCYSGDRIAEILCIAGYGSIQIVSGVPTVVLPTWTNSFGNTVSLLNIATSYKTYIPYVYGNANGTCQVEPFYYDTPVTNSSAIGLIQQITDTDSGAFYQGPDGAFYFNPQNYYGTWAWNTPTTGTGTWTLNPAISPSGYYVWADNNTGVPYDAPSLQVVKDDVDLWTTVKVSPQSGTEQVYENVASEALYGYSTLQKGSTVPISLNAALSTANFLGYLFHSPLPRVQNVELRTETTNQAVSSPVGYYIPALIGTLFGDVVQFIRNAPNASGSGIVNQKMAVEAISHQFHADPGTWHTSFVLDPYPVRS